MADKFIAPTNRIYGKVAELKNPEERKFFELLTSQAFQFLDYIINSWASGLIFRKKRKEIGELKIYQGMKVVMSALLAMFLQINDLEDLGSSFEPRFKKLLSDILEFSEQDKIMADNLIRIKCSDVMIWPDMLYDYLVRALVYEDYPMSKPLTDEQINRYWNGVMKDPYLDKPKLYSYISSETVGFRAFAKKIPSDFFANWYIYE